MPMVVMKKDVQVTVRLPAALRDALKDAAEADKRTLASYITLALEDHVQRISQAKRRR